jgi:hypothetical protein
VRPRELWGRRSVAVGVVLVSVALIGGLILLIAGDDSGNGNEAGPRSGADLAGLQNRFLDHTVVNPDKGISVRRPASWKVTKKAGVINLESKDNCAVMQLSAPVAAGRAKGLREDGVSVLRSQFKNARVRPATNSQIGGVPTRSDAITFKDPKGNNVQVLLGVGTGKRNAYLTELVIRDPSCQGDLQMAQLMLSSAQFTK